MGLELGEKPKPVNTHLRNTIIVPSMIGSIVGVHNGKTFNQVEIKPEMIGHYLGEFSITYKPVHHGRPGIGGMLFVCDFFFFFFFFHLIFFNLATHSSRFVPLK